MMFPLNLTLQIKGANNSDPIQIGLIASDGTAWNTIPSSFVSLNPLLGVGDTINNTSFYALLTYNYAGSNRNVNFYVVKYKTPMTKTAPDFSFTTATGTNIEPIGNQWGFGSSPQSITSTDGYTSIEGYNSYVAQNLEVAFLRTWNINPPIPATSTTSGVYAMFNTNSAFSLYNLNATITRVPDLTTGLNFQLYMTETNASTDLYNSVSNPDTLVTTTTSTSNYPTLNPPNSYNFAINYDTVNLSNPINNYTKPQASSISCLLKGTKILTERWFKLIEKIKLDDFIITADHRKVSIEKIYSTQVFAKNDETIPYIVKKKTYGAFEDLYLSKHHCVLINDEYFDVPHRIGLELSDIKHQMITYYHIETENYLYDTMIANGVVVETYGKYKVYEEVPNKYKNKR